MSRLPKKYYQQSTIKVAQQLLGSFLIRKIDNRKLIGKIVETEAYIGLNDKACHASCGMTKRNKVMFGPAGFWYVYIIYGIFNCLNIVTEKENHPSAVLIRGLEPVKGIDLMKKNRSKEELKDLCSGPGKLCQALKIDRSLNNSRAFGNNCRLWIENGEIIKPSQIVAAKRIGVDYAGQWAEKKWRFYIKDNHFVSRY